MRKSPLPEQDGPTFDPATHWCPRHMESFRGPDLNGSKWLAAQWALATMALFELAVRRKDIQAAAGHDTAMLDRVLREYAPLCCLVGDAATAHWTKLALGPLEGYRAALSAYRATK